MRRKVILAIGSLLIWKPLKTLGSIFSSTTKIQELAESIDEVRKIEKQLTSLHKNYLSFVNVEKLRVGLYVLKTVDQDTQQPHIHDEIYYVISGKGKFKTENINTYVTEGTVIYVRAKVDHKFYDIEEDLKILVFFSNML